MSSTWSSSISHYHSSSWSGHSFPFHSHQSFSPSVRLPLPSTYIPEASHLVHCTPGESKLRLSLTDNSPSVARYSCLLPWPALYTTTTALFLTRNDVHISLLLSILQWLLIGCGGKIHTFCHGRAGPAKSRPRYHFPLCLQGSSHSGLILLPTHPAHFCLRVFALGISSAHNIPLSTDPSVAGVST